MNIENIISELATIDRWKSLRKILYRNQEPEAVLISYPCIPNYSDVTPNTLPAFTARESHQSQGSLENDLQLTKSLINWGHTTPFEALQVVFRLSGISKSLAGQWTRHRIGIGWTFRSTRYVNASTNGYVYPALDYIDDNKRALDALLIYEEGHRASQALMERVSNLGVKNQEQRRLQPVGFATSAYVYTNARALRHFFDLRVDLHAEWEIRRMAIMMFLEILKIAPTVFEDQAEKFSKRFKKD